MPDALQPPFLTLRRQPLYLQAKTSILDAISSGAWKPGEPIPSEAKLAALFGTSIGTVRHAVEELVAENILVRRHGHGTYVKSYESGGFWNFFQRFQSIDGKILRFSSKVLSCEVIPAPEAAARHLSIPAATPVYHLHRQVFLDRNPYGDDVIFLAADAVPGLSTEALSGIADSAGSVYRFYESTFGLVITDASDCIEVIGADEALAELCAVPVGTPFFKLIRTARTFSKKPVEYRIERCWASGICMRFD